MKTFLICALLCLVDSVFSQPLTVHEWGTFTTLLGSKGSTLAGLYFEEEQLPPFVYHFPGFSPDPNTRQCNNVTVKMETPVLYFYSPVERTVQVHVDFPMGTISQWYPNRSGGEVPPAGIIDLSGNPRGMIDWNATVLSPSSTAQLTQQNSASDYHKWTDPRQTDANLVRNDSGEVEKYLFYRGLANFPMPVSAHFIDSVHLSVTNTSQLDIPFIYIYDHTTSSSAVIWGIGPLKAGETKIFKPGHSYGEDYHITENDTFRIALQTAGLTYKEAAAMLNTWQDGYFQTMGFKIFWIVPRSLTDQILPITITPAPDTLQRVLVGKTEVLTPAFERQLLINYRAGKMAAYNNDRYHVAYLQRAQELDLENPIPHPLVVHEWSTFTSLYGSHGSALSGLYFEENPLPLFVYHFPGFSPDTANVSGFHPCKNVMVKMESPFIYFYSDIERNLQININFPHGIIPQWYPNRNGGDMEPSGDTLDLSIDHQGTIAWDATVLAKNTEKQVTELSGTTTSKWEAARQTDANLVTTQDGEVEKFLFYNGIADISLPLELYFSDSTQLIIRNNSASNIPFMYIYDHMDPSAVRIWGIGPLASEETKVFTMPASYSYNDNTQFQKALVNAGLTDKEAQTLLNMRSEEYFQTTGFKVFWIIPRHITDNILPMTLNPAPDTLQRVLVGKTEILTLPFEKELLDYFTQNGNLDKWKNHPFYLAYLQRVKELYKPITKDGVQSDLLHSSFILYPNPAQNHLQIFSTSANVSFTIRNILGEALITSSQSQIDIHSLVPGLYFATAADGARRETIKFIKN